MMISYHPFSWVTTYELPSLIEYGITILKNPQSDYTLSTPHGALSTFNGEDHSAFDKQL